MKLPTEMSFEGIKHPEKIQAIQWCSCRNQFHRVALINNSIVLLNHNLRRELAMLDLGGPVCRCMRLYFAILKRQTRYLVQTFEPYVKEVTRKCEFRNRSLFSPTKVHTIDMAESQTQRLIKLLIRYKCNYKDIDDTTVITVTCTGARPYVHGSWHYRNGVFGNDTYMALYINVDKSWKKNIYDRGFAVVDDYLIIGTDAADVPSAEEAVIAVTQPALAHNGDKNFAFGTINCIIKRHITGWRFKFMDSNCYSYHPLIPARSSVLWRKS